MSQNAKIYAQAARRDLPRKQGLSGEEKRALSILRKEAKRSKATLASGGKGGLPPSLVLGVMRRDQYKCKLCGCSDSLSMHHKGGIVESNWLSNKGHLNQPNNLVTICVACHDRIHQKARREGVDSSQIRPKADLD